LGSFLPSDVAGEAPPPTRLGSFPPVSVESEVPACPLPVSHGFELEQLGVAATEGDRLRVGALFLNGPIGQHQEDWIHANRNPTVLAEETLHVLDEENRRIAGESDIACGRLSLRSLRLRLRTPST
jgi:hypothetical protein